MPFQLLALIPQCERNVRKYSGRFSKIAKPKKFIGKKVTLTPINIIRN
jgi:hypothetical protein